MKRKISTRIFIALLAVGLIPLVTIFLYISSRYSADLTASVLKQNVVVQQASVAALSGYLKKIEFISNTCFDASLQKILTSDPGDAWMRYNTQAQIEKGIRVNLDLFDILDSVDYVSISTVKGATYNIGVSPFAAQAQQILADISGALDSQYKLHGLFSIDSFLSQKISGKLLYIRHINDISGQQKNIGSILILFDERQFAQLLAAPENSTAVVTDKEGHILYTNFHSDRSTLEEQMQCAKPISQMQNSSNLIKSSFQTDTLELTVTYYDNLEVLLKPVNRLRIITLGIMLASVMMVLLLSSVLSIGLVRPIRNLQRAVLKVQDGDFDIDIQVTTKDELGELCNSFNMMARHINLLVNKVYATQLSEKEAIIASLTSQINPHFLYNTLDMVKSMADFEGAAEISEIAMALSGLFRYSTQNENLVVTIQDELDNLKNYTRILRARFGDRIRFDIQAEAECLDCKIIKVCLQPLIENSVSHGLSQKAGDGTISITVAQCGEEIIITQCDDGAGMPPETLLALQQSHAEGHPYVQKDGHTGVGLYNIHRRIRLYYGESYGLTITSEEQVGTTVTIRIPIQR